MPSRNYRGGPALYRVLAGSIEDIKKHGDPLGFPRRSATSTLLILSLALLISSPRHASIHQASVAVHRLPKNARQYLEG